MEKTYRTVKASKRLPKEKPSEDNSWKFVITKDNGSGIVIYQNGKWLVEKDGEEWSFASDINYWLEEIEQPESKPMQDECILGRDTSIHKRYNEPMQTAEEFPNKKCIYISPNREIISIYIDINKKWKQFHRTDIIEQYVQQCNPIQLPSDGEVKTHLECEIEFYSGHYRFGYKSGFQDAINWLKQKLK